MPFDVCQTLMQKSKASKNKLRKVIVEIYRTKGMIGFMAGWRPKMIQYTVHAFLTENLIQ